MWRGSASGARINDLHAYLCAFRSKPPVSANRVTQTRSSLPPSLVPLPRKRIPEKRFENFQSSEPSGAEPSRAARSRHVGYIFFFFPLSLSTFHPLPSLPVQSGASIPFDGETGRSTGALSLFSRGREGEDIGKSGIKRMMVTKREKFYPLSSPLARSSTTSLDDLHSVELEASVGASADAIRCVCVCMRICVCMRVISQRHSNVTKGRNFVNFFSRRAARRGGN